MKSLLTLGLSLLLSLSITANKRITILPIGDSITEGKEGQFESYLFPLWEMLYTAGYEFEFVGQRSTPTRIGALNHCAHGGKNAEYLETVVDSVYRRFPADIVLLHSGHNHFDTEKPVDGILKAHKSIIKKIWAVNPDALILDAAVIQSGKLPKYSYISELNKELKKMIDEVASDKLFLVDQSQFFDWKKHTIDDKVHPNKEGAKTIARTWFNAIKLHVKPSQEAYTPKLITYKKGENYQLDLHLFKPVGYESGAKFPVIVFFFGGGWTYGTPLQFYRECAYYASKGILAVAADYRISSINKTTPFESFDDAKDAIRWLKQHADEYSIDTNRIIASGASAGGQLVAALGNIRPKEDEAHRLSYRPDLLLLYYPVADNGPDGHGPQIIKKRYQEFSPLHNISSDSPATLFILGTKDKYVPVETGLLYQRKMLDAGVDCDLILIEGAKHPIFEYRKPLTEKFYDVRYITDNFLRKQGIIE